MASTDPRVGLMATLDTAVHLLDQFSASLPAPPSQTQPGSGQSPLPLLTASATSLKQIVTRFSLLTLTPPFTPSALSPLLNTLNASILPSLITAAHLILPESFTKAFSTEATTLAKQTLSDLRVLLQLVTAQAGHPLRPVTHKEKDALTQATGQVWARCDALISFADGGLASFMTLRVGQWLELMRDAVKELEEWDPEEDVGEDPFGLDASNDEDDKDSIIESRDADDRAVLQSGVKMEALKVLTRIPQSIHVVVKQRLGASQLPPSEKLSVDNRLVLDSIASRTKQISEFIDESAEAMYMGDLERCLKLAGEARTLTIDVVESVCEPWEPGPESKEDVYIRRASRWIRQVQATPGEFKTSMNDVTDGTKALNIN